MGVLSPETVSRVESSQRIQQVLADPASLSMVFQPIVDVGSAEVIAVEALARFDVTPGRSPDAWFHEAHQVGLGVENEAELDVIRRLAVHCAQGYHLGRPAELDAVVSKAHS